LDRFRVRFGPCGSRRRFDNSLTNRLPPAGRMGLQPSKTIPAHRMSSSVNWRDGLLFLVIAGLLVAGGMLGWDRMPRRHPRPGSLASRSSSRWTALLVLMPVAILAVVGWIAVVRDRVSVEDETRR